MTQFGVRPFQNGISDAARRIIEAGRRFERSRYNGREVSSQTIARPQPVDIQPECLRRIAVEVSKKTGVSLAEIIGEPRHAEVIAARYETFYRAACETSLSLTHIAVGLNKDVRVASRAVKLYAKRNKLPIPRGLRGVA